MEKMLGPKILDRLGSAEFLKKMCKSPFDYILKLYWKIYFSHWRMAWKFFEWLIINCIEKVSYWFGSVGGKINSFHGVFIAKIRKKILHNAH